MKNILLPTDFSNNAFNAIEYAVQFYGNEDCTFYLLNTFTPIAYNMATFADGYSTLMLEEITRKNSEQGLLEIEKNLREKYDNPKHAFKRLAVFNLLTDAITAVVKKHDINLIVMGTKGATGAKEIFLGTNTMFVIKKATCPVIAVPENFTFKKPNEILFPTDFKFSMKNENLNLLRDICKLHKSKLNILNVYFGAALSKSQEEIKDNFANFFKDNAHLFHSAEYVDLVEAVQQFQLKHKVNFLVMIQNKHSFFENLFFKPVIKQMVFHTQVPFMVNPPMELVNK